MRARRHHHRDQPRGRGAAPGRRWPCAAELRVAAAAAQGLQPHGRQGRPATWSGAEAFDDYFTFAIERNPWDAVVSLYFWKYKDRAELPDFETYVQEIWIEQLANNRRLYRIRGQMALDRVLRYENLDDELGEVWEQLGLPGAPDLPRAKGNARPAGHYRELYTDASRERVADGVRRRHRGLRLRVLSPSR